MYYMKKRLNIKTGNGRIIKTGVWLGAFFAFATILSSFGTGSLPQINSISDAMFATWNINKMITGAALAILLALIIIGGIKRIAKVTSALVPAMAIIYFLGSFLVIATNYQNIIPSFLSIFSDAFTGSAAVGGFLGASFAFSFNRGVNRGLFSNEAGQGSAPIAHSAARAHEPVSEGVVAILEPFIDTIIICMLTGMVLLSSGVWNEKLSNRFEDADMVIVHGDYKETSPAHTEALRTFIRNGKGDVQLFSGQMEVVMGMIKNEITLIHAQSIGEEIVIKSGDIPFTGNLNVQNGRLLRDASAANIMFYGKSLLHSAALTTEAFNRSILGHYGKYIVAIGLLLFAFSTAISWSYYGSRAVTYLWGTKYEVYYKIAYVLGFFLASFTDTTIIWNLSYITIAVMTIPNLLGLWILHKDIKSTIRDYWVDFRMNWPDAKLPMGEK